MSFQKASSQEYFQQKVNYNISVTLNDRKNELDGFETVEYVNNSHDTLKLLYFHLWPNAYSNNSTALAREIMNSNGKSRLFRDPELKGYIDSLDFVVDGSKAEWHLMTGNIDICKITLKVPIKPGDRVVISTPFHVKIPKNVASRFGHAGQSYQISQWYPKPAVYDNSGWHKLVYLNQAEFYSEFGNFDVSITLPDNYIVGASGDLQNEDEIKRLNKMADDSTWMNKSDTISTHFPPSSEKMKTVRYTRDNIHDFAWFADKRYHVMKGKVRLPASGKEVTTWAMFTNSESKYWKSSISYINAAISDYSEWIGGYPYNNFTAVQGTINAGSGMEYPGLTIIDHVGDPYLLEQVLAHEICHSWFYGALGSNERRYPFMDESIASAYEARYMDEKHPGKKLWEITFKNYKLARILNIVNMPVQRIRELDWLVPARQNLEQPLNLAATDYSEENYSSMIYSKGAIGFNYLQSYLGTQLFDSIMHVYYRVWKNRHPGPDDLRTIFEDKSGKDLSWFFDDFLGTTKHLDYKIGKIKGGRLLLKNKGEMDSPVSISGITGDSLSTDYWIDGFRGEKWVDIKGISGRVLKIDAGHKMTELFRINNTLRTSGVFRKSAPVQLQLLYTIEDPDKRYLFYLPAVNWTKSDGFMAGIALNNGLTLLKPVEYSLIPFYSFRNSDFSGVGKISFNLIPYQNLARLATFSLEGTRFATPGNSYYLRLKAGLDLSLRPGNLADGVNQRIFGYYIAASDLAQIEQLRQPRLDSYMQFGYVYGRERIINPFNILFFIESGKSYGKSSVEFNYRYSYNGKRNGLDIRLFSGVMFKNKTSDSYYAFAASGRSGYQEYLYNAYYPDRFTGFPKTFWSRQMTLSEGGLVTPLNDTLGYSRWLFSLSLASSLPQKFPWLPLKPFLNLLLNDHGYATKKPTLFFEAGFKTGIWNFFEIYIPLIVSENISSIHGPIRERVRFILRLEILDPVKVNRIFSE